jgi:hypothetical protein
MTSMARPKRDFVLSTRAPYAPVVMLIGAAVVIGVVIRLLNTSPVADHPLSGAPVGTGNGPVVVTDPATKTASGSLSLLLPVGAAGESMAVGPSAFPAGAQVGLSVHLPTDQATAVQIGLAQLEADGTLKAAGPISVDVEPDVNGTASVRTSVAALTEELGPGLYRIDLRWEGESIGVTDVALGQLQPGNIAIFDEPRLVSFAAATYTGVQVDGNGAVTAEKPYELGKASGASAVAFAVLNGTPHLLISNGVWAGYWMPVGDGMTIQ